MDSAKIKIFEFAENHPNILLGVISMLVVIIVIMYLNSRGYGVGLGGVCAKKKKKESMNDEEEVDDLIESIHKKQKAGRRE